MAKLRLFYMSFILDEPFSVTNVVAFQPVPAEGRKGGLMDNS